MVWNSVWAVVSGLFYTIALTTIIDILMYAVGVFAKFGAPIDSRLAAIALSYRFVVGISGAYFTAWIAPFNPARHVFVLASIVTMFGLIGMITTWDSGLAPHWFSASIAILAYPQSWLGLKMHDFLNPSSSPQASEPNRSLPPKNHYGQRPNRKNLASKPKKPK